MPNHARYLCMSEKKHCMVIVHDLVFLKIVEYISASVCVHARERRQHQPQYIVILND